MCIELFFLSSKTKAMNSSVPMDPVTVYTGLTGDFILDTCVMTSKPNQ